MPHFLCAGSPEASASSVFVPAATWCSGSPQQRASAEKRPVRQTPAQKQAQDQEDAETHHQPGRLSTTGTSDCTAVTGTSDYLITARTRVVCTSTSTRAETHPRFFKNILLP